MHGINPADPGRTIDWGKTSNDYSVFRPGPPDCFYERLSALGLGLPGQRILDLGTGTGVLARRFAGQGSFVAGVDISGEQIEAAKNLAAAQKLNVDFRVSPAETTPFEPRTFDAVTANQCWLYFDKAKTIAEVRRLLKPGGILCTSHFSWLPRQDEVARKTEELVLKHNPQWTAFNFSGEIPVFPQWAQKDFNVKSFFYYDHPVAFTHESWRGRMRACRGVGAGLNAEEVRRFDEDLAEKLKQWVPEQFTVLHRIDAHFFVFKEQ